MGVKNLMKFIYKYYPNHIKIKNIKDMISVTRTLKLFIFTLYY